MDSSPGSNPTSLKGDAPASCTTATPVAQSHALDPWAFLHRKLKGRYKLAVFLGVFTAAAGAFAGWRMTQPLFRAEGLVRIASTLPPVLVETDQNKPIPMFDSFLQAQQMTISSPPVARLAMETPQWQALNRRTWTATAAAGVQAFREQLAVDVRPRSDVIRISFSDIDAQGAAGGVNAVIAAYQQVYAAREAEMHAQRLAALQDRRAALIGELANHHAQLDQAGAGLAPLHTASLHQLAMVAKPVKEETPTLDAAKPEDAVTGMWPPVPSVPLTLVPEQIGFRDPIMRRYLDDQQRQEEQLDEAAATMGPAHHYVLRLQRSLARGAERIRQYAETYNRFNAAKSTAPGAQLPVIQQPAASDPDALAALMRQAIRVERLRSDAEQSRKELLEVTRRMNVLRAEGTIGTRLSVISLAEAPLAPQIDRRVRAAAAGGVAGFCFPASILVLLRLGAVRYRSYHDAAQDLENLAPLFGRLPQVREKHQAAAASSIHHIRARLRATRPGMQGASVYLVTSPTPGEGKTSIALSLGISFAASGSRTLLIDGAFIGRGLSTLFGATETPGLCEALRDRQFLDRISKTTTGLSVLAAGQSGQADAYALSHDSIQNLLTAVRQHFDIILIDSSSILDGIEASVLAPQVTGVILTVARGQQAPVVERSLRQLRSIGAPLAAIIFNKASSSDLWRTSSVASRKDADHEALDTATSFGPLIAAVLRSINRARTADMVLSSGVRPAVSDFTPPWTRSSRDESAAA